MHRTILWTGTLLLLTPAALPARNQAPQASAGQTMRTPWGKPDIQGVFTTDDELGVPFERPNQFGTRQSGKRAAHHGQPRSRCDTILASPTYMSTPVTKAITPCGTF